MMMEGTLNQRFVNLNKQDQSDLYRSDLCRIKGSVINDDQVFDRLEVLRSRINDENYLHNAIHKMALVMSNELAAGKS